MDAVSPRAEALRAAVVAAAAATLVAVLSPPGGDSAAHLYRTDLVRDGVHVWDNLWYGGQYPFASYSLLYYLPAALVGNVPLVVASAVVAAALFAALAVHEWGHAARWPARAFGVVAAAPLYSGTYSYALGLAAALGSLRLLQKGRTWPAIACAGLSLGFSALAFAFLCVALAAVAVSRARIERGTVVVAGGVALVAAVQLAVIVLFPTDGRYPYSHLTLTGVVALSALGAALAAQSSRARPLAVFFVLWGVVNLASYLVPSPFGDNLARLRAIVFPLVLLAAVLARFRPRPLAAAALGVALVYNVVPDVLALPKRVEDERTSRAAFWAPALEYVRGHGGGRHRVEVVPTFGHWEAYWVPRAGLALARGWYRQIDVAENPELYRDPLSPSEYRDWLRRMAVRFVLLPDARLGPLGAGREADLLRSGRAGLPLVFRTPDWLVYESRHAPPILDGFPVARLERFDHDRIVGTATRTGAYRLRVRFTPYWQVRAGAVCVERGAEGMSRLVVRRPGRFVLATAERPAALLRLALRGDRSCERAAFRSPGTG